MEAFNFLVAIQVLSSALTILAVLYLVFRKIIKSKKDKFDRRDY
jgi:hypothetical protein